MNKESKATNNAIIDELVGKLNVLQAKCYDKGALSVEEKGEWSATCLAIRMQGYSLKHRKGWDGDKRICRWWAVSNNATTGRNTECQYVYTDVRPNDGMRVLKGDCTTRAMTFILNGSMSYREIESLQYRLAYSAQAQGRNVRRNSTTIWSKVLLDRGYSELMFAGGQKIKRSVLGRMFNSGLTHPIASISKGHVAVIDTDGIVRDTWDSRGGRCYKLLVHNDDMSRVCSRLAERGVRWGVGVNELLAM
jgi:hypothetical protein